MLRVSRYIQTIDSHTMGEPTRIVTGGTPRLAGKTMMEKKRNIESRLDWLRKLLMNEPRGHKDMFGAIMLDPCEEDCDLGVIFMDSGGYLNMCGHGAIGTVTTAINLGMIEPKPIVRLDTPAGVIECRVKIVDGIAKQVSFTNVPAFVFQTEIPVEVPELGTIYVDVAFGGSFFAIVDASNLGLRLIPEEQQKLASLGMAIRDAANRQIKVAHPLKPEINKIDLIEFSLLVDYSSDIIYRNAVVFGNGQIDRSPCGTGTCAKMAVLHHKEKLKIGQNFYHQSIIDSTFTGQLIQKTNVGNHSAVIPEIKGSAYITGMSQFVIEEDDPYREGFLVV